MSSKKQIIEINGSSYDLATGLLVEAGSKRSGSASVSKLAEPKPDKPAAATPIKVKVNKPQKTKTTLASEHKVAAHLAAHTTSPSSTLMRNGLAKPGPSFKRQAKANGSLHSDNKKLIKSAPTLLEDNEHAERKRHALSLSRSQSISHFSASGVYRNNHSQASTSTAKEPVATQPVPPAQQVSESRAVNTEPLSTTDEILQKALERATAHEQKSPKVHVPISMKVKLSMLAFAALGIGAVGLIASQNLTGAKLQVASAEAGFAIKTPAYLPAGFTQSGVNSNPGSAALRYNGSFGSYTITQKASSWTPENLRDYYVLKADPNYQTVHTNGLTVYLYGIGNATWVNKGVWYVIQSGDALSNNQLVELASSL